MLGMRKHAASLYKSYKLFFISEAESVQLCGCQADFQIKSLKDYNQVVNFESHEGTMFKDIIENLEYDDVFFDIGAHIGLYSCLIQDHLKDGQVVAFEPHPANYEQLEQNISLNKQSIQTHNLALGNQNTEMGLSVSSMESGTGNSSLLGDDKNNTVACSVRKGDRLISENIVPLPDIIKIDVEGAEFNVLSGLREILEMGTVRAIYCEVHEESTVGPSLSSFDSSVDDLYTFFDKIGFDVTILEKRDRDFHIRADNKKS